MRRCRWRHLILLLVVLVVLLQLVHLILISRLVSTDSSSQWITTLALPILLSQGQEEERLLAALRRRTILDGSGEYVIAQNLVMPSSKLELHDLSLVTQCSMVYLHYLIDLANAWKGPLSVAVFAQGHEFPRVIQMIASLQRCSPGIAANASFHLVAPVSVDFQQIPALSGQSIPCADLRLLNGNITSYNHPVPYPNNLLRNVARSSVRAQYFLVLDIDLMPSAGLQEQFLAFANKRGLFGGKEKTVYVVPAFEADDHVPLPVTNKGELLTWWKHGLVRPFYSKVCWKCQEHTDYKNWMLADHGEELEPAYEVFWKDPWEPFYIGHISVPDYDERFRQYGFNRISQVCELHVAGYSFTVLSNAFLIHRGFKHRTSFHSSKDEEQEHNRELYRAFKSSLKLKYPDSSRRCY